MRRPAGVGINEKAIEAVVNRVLMDRSGHRADKPQMGGVAPVAQTDKSPNLTDEIEFNGSIEAFGESGLNAVAGALDMFRRN